MPDWTGPAIDLTMLFVWIGYLNIFLVSYLRQNRSVLHIAAAAAKGKHARALITNLGNRNVYVLTLAVDFETADGRYHTVVSDREEWGEDAFDRVIERTLQGTLAPGDTRDVGSFEDVVSRALTRIDDAPAIDELTSLRLTVVAAADSASSLIGAEKRYRIAASDGALIFTPDTLLTHQIGGLFRTRRLERMIRS